MKSKIITNSYPLLFILCFLYPAYIGGYNLHPIRNNSSLSNSSITSIDQDKNGNLWIGTCDGLNIYNGQSPTQYIVDKNRKALSGTLIDKVIVWSDSILWLQSYHGLDILNTENNVLTKYPNIAKSILSTKDKEERMVVMCKDEQLLIKDVESIDFTEYIIRDLKFDNTVSIAFNNKNELLITTLDGYIIKYRETDNLIFERQGIIYKHPTPIIYCQQIDQTILFIDKQNNLYELDDEKTEKIFDFSIAHKDIENIVALEKFNDSYFVGDKVEGAFQVKRQGRKYVANKLPIQSGIFCFMRDRYQDILWIGTDGKGVYSYAEDQYSVRSILSNDFSLILHRPIRTLHIDKENILWIGSKGDGIVKIRDYKRTDILSENDIEYINSDNSKLWSNAVYVIKESKLYNGLWVGTEYGLNFYSFDTKQWIQIEIKVDNNPLLYIHDILEDGDNLWLATVGMGITKNKLDINRKVPKIPSTTHISVSNNISDNYFYSILDIGEQLIATNRGLGLAYINKEKARITQTVSFDDSKLNEVYSICKATDEAYMIGTAKGLLMYKSPKDYSLLSQRTILENKVIHSIVSQNKDIFWIGTNLGLFKFDSKQLTFSQYKQGENIEINEFSDGAYYTSSPNNEILIGGTNGFVSIAHYPSRVKKNYTPPIYYSDLRIYGEQVDISKYMTQFSTNDQVRITLSHTENVISLKVIAVDHIDQNNLQCVYKLNESNIWINASNYNELSFTNLSPGENLVKLKYINVETEAETPTKELIIEILPPWYKTTWAIVLYYIFIVAIIIGAMSYWLWRTEKKRALELEKIKQKHKEKTYESKLNFFANIANEFRIPLTLIHGPCVRILEQNKIDKNIRTYSKIIYDNTERLQLLINNILKFRHVEAGNIQPSIESIDLYKFLVHITRSFSDYAQNKEIDLKLHIQKNIRWNSDKNLLATVISNILSLILQHTDNYGAVWIDVDIEQDDKLHIALTTDKLKEEEMGQIDLSDKYKSLDEFENSSNNLFAYTTRNRLDISMANSIVRLLGGSLNNKQTKSGELQFLITIPQNKVNYITSPNPDEYENTTQKVPLETLEIKTSQTYDNNKNNLLIINKNKEIQWLLHELLEDRFNITYAQSVEEAQQSVANTHPDLIVCNEHVSDAENIAFMKEVKTEESTAHIPIVMISADDDNKINTLNAGADLFILIPFDVNYFKTSITKLLTRKEILKDYYASSQSSFQLKEGQLINKEDLIFIQQIQKIIDNNLETEKLDAKFIAKQMKMNTRSLYRKIKDTEYNFQIAEAIRDSRLQKATTLLKSTDISIEEIRIKVGFATRSTFFEHFAKKYNCSPNEYRKQNK